jgi:hypothetical protein
VKGFACFHPGQRTTLIAALGCQGFKASLFGSWYTDGSVFLTFIQQNFVPNLKPGDIVVMDNLSAHKVAGVKEAIQKVGAHLLYLPPYSLFGAKKCNSSQKDVTGNYGEKSKNIRPRNYQYLFLIKK